MVERGDFKRKMQKRYKDVPPSISPTPQQIETNRKKAQLIEELSDITGVGVDLLAVAFYPDGKFLDEKFRRFEKSRKRILNYPKGVEMMAVLNETCFNPCGSINKKRLKELWVLDQKDS